MKIDSHQHFWIYNQDEYDWISNDMEILQKNYVPDQLQAELASIGFDGSIVVQARQSLEETQWLLNLAEHNNFIKGVVGWVDLCSPGVEEQLIQFSEHPKLVGVRHVIHDEVDNDFMLRKEFLNGIGLLSKFGLTYDILVFPRHLPNTIQFVRQFPEQVFVLDHLAKPFIKDKKLPPWQEDIEKLARFKNVYCKLSGMVTEADVKNWKPTDLIPYLDIVFAAFGSNRLMIGSDWPVCRLAGTYKQIMEVVLDYITKMPDQDRKKILGINAVEAYKLKS
ncbi:amidohydrolase family protein [candidate division KSB1 bacterium]|nr:amidohydrolase family protein [candidate division KSB1 bacterium]